MMGRALGSQVRESKILGFCRMLLPAGPSLETSGGMRTLTRLFLPETWRQAAHSPRIEKFARLLVSLLLWSSVFIPRIPLGRLGGYYGLDIKTEDFLLAFAGLWFLIACPGAKVSENPLSRIESSFLLFLILAGVSIFSGFSAGTLDKPFVSLLYLVKWFEYFLAFAFALRQMRSDDDLRFFLRQFFFFGLALALYGYAEHFSPVSKAVYPNYYRLYERPPFHGDANHVGGLLAVWMAFFAGIYLKSPGKMAASSRDRDGLITDPRWFWLLPLAIFFVFFPMIWTFSRKSYFALAGALLFAFFLPGSNRRRWLVLGCWLVCIGLLLPTRLADRLENLGEVFTDVDPFHSSWAGNLEVWGKCFWNFGHFWLFGPGLGARHRLFYESQYVMILTETGIAGFTAFMLLLLIPAFCALRQIKESGTKGMLAFAWLVAWAAVLMHNLSCVSLTVSKVAMPWWILTGSIFGFLRLKSEARS